MRIIQTESGKIGRLSEEKFRRVVKRGDLLYFIDGSPKVIPSGCHFEGSVDWMANIPKPEVIQKSIDIGELHKFLKRNGEAFFDFCQRATIANKIQDEDENDGS